MHSLTCNLMQDLALEEKFARKTLEDVVKLKKRDVLVTAAMHLRRKQPQDTAASLNNLIACFKVSCKSGRMSAWLQQQHLLAVRYRPRKQYSDSCSSIDLSCAVNQVNKTAAVLPVHLHGISNVRLALVQWVQWA